MKNFRKKPGLINKKTKPKAKVKSVKPKLIDNIGRSYRIDVSTLKNKIKTENHIIQSLLESGIRQFLGLDPTPITPEMKDFLINMGVITALSVSDTQEIITQLNS